MKKLEKWVNNFAEIAAFGFGVRLKHNDNYDKNSDDYIDYLG